jgi:signal transduction histidine kinase
MCDSEQVKQVLLNLIMNAIQATGQGAVDLHAFVKDGSVCIAVRDHGAGIPAEDEDRIFEPFFTTKETGSGLGLAIATRIAEQHGGTLSAENSPGQGLTMTLKLPLTNKVRATA